MKSLIKIAHRAAERSTFRQRIGSVLFQGSTVLETGTNQLRHQSAIRTGHWPNSLHSEMDIVSKLVRAGRMKQLKGASMLVLRLKRDGSYGLALPCNNCFSVLQSVGIKRIIFSTDDNNFSTLIL